MNRDGLRQGRPAPVIGHRRDSGPACHDQADPGHGDERERRERQRRGVHPFHDYVPLLRRSKNPVTNRWPVACTIAPKCGACHRPGYPVNEIHRTNGAEHGARVQALTPILSSKTRFRMPSSVRAAAPSKSKPGSLRGWEPQTLARQGHTNPPFVIKALTGALACARLPCSAKKPIARGCLRSPSVENDLPRRPARL